MRIWSDKNITTAIIQILFISYIFIFNLVFASGLNSGLNSTLSVRYLIDVSGSMQKSDPDNIRLNAVLKSLKSLPEGTEVGIWTYAKQVNNLVPPTKLSPSLINSAAMLLRSAPNYGDYHNLSEAMKSSFKEWSWDDTGEKWLFIITDSEPVAFPNDPIKNQLSLLQMNEYWGYTAKQDDIKVMVFDLGRENLVAEYRPLVAPSDGFYRRVDNVNDLYLLLQQFINNESAQTTEKLTNRIWSIPEGTQELRLTIDKKNNRPVYLMTPMGYAFGPKSGLNYVSWIEGSKQDEIILKSPAPGNWEVLGGGVGRWISFQHPDLLEWLDKLPTNYWVGESLVLPAMPPWIDYQKADINLSSMENTMENTADKANKISITKTWEFVKSSLELPAFSKPGWYQIQISLGDGVDKLGHWLWVHPTPIGLIESWQIDGETMGIVGLQDTMLAAGSLKIESSKNSFQNIPPSWLIDIDNSLDKNIILSAQTSSGRQIMVNWQPEQLSNLVMTEKVTMPLTTQISTKEPEVIIEVKDSVVAADKVTDNSEIILTEEVLVEEVISEAPVIEDIDDPFMIDDSSMDPWGVDIDEEEQVVDALVGGELSGEMLTDGVGFDELSMELNSQEVGSVSERSILRDTPTSDELLLVPDFSVGEWLTLIAALLTINLFIGGGWYMLRRLIKQRDHQWLDNTVGEFA